MHLLFINYAACIFYLLLFKANDRALFACDRTHTHTCTLVHFVCPPGPVALKRVSARKARARERARKRNTPHSAFTACDSLSLSLRSIRRLRMHSSFSFHLPLRTDVSRCRCRSRRSFSTLTHTERRTHQQKKDVGNNKRQFLRRVVAFAFCLQLQCMCVCANNK